MSDFREPLPHIISSKFRKSQTITTAIDIAIHTPNGNRNFSAIAITPTYLKYIDLRNKAESGQTERQRGHAAACPAARATANGGESPRQRPRDTLPQRGKCQSGSHALKKRVKRPSFPPRFRQVSISQKSMKL
jgi:hypothetical protein